MDSILGMDIHLLTLFFCISICFALYLNLMPFGLMGGKIYDIEEKVNNMHEVFSAFDNMFAEFFSSMGDFGETVERFKEEAIEAAKSEEDMSKKLFEDRWK